MKRYIAKRLLQLIPILLGITLFSFLLMNTGTADVIDVMENNTGSALWEEEKNALREELGLDRPLLLQYVIWLGKTVRGIWESPLSPGSRYLPCLCRSCRRRSV